MKKTHSKLIIVEILQKAIAGQLKANTTFNPQHIADAINQMVDFDTPLLESGCKEVIKTVVDSVEVCKNEMDEEFEKLDPKKNTLLRNFIRGKSHAYQEILDILNKIA